MKKPITKEEFLQDIRDEIEALKLNATQHERDRLNPLLFNPMRQDNCIYGQMTGWCTNKRAHDLILKSCKRVFYRKSINDSPLCNLQRNTISTALKKLNGEPTQKQLDHYNRDDYYLSALEGYIMLKETKKFHRGILSYIKGTSGTLILE